METEEEKKENEIVECAECGAETNASDMRANLITERLECDDCFDEHHIHCNDCERTIHTRDMTSFDIGYETVEVCENCADNYRECRGCGNDRHLDNLTNGRCEDCRSDDNDPEGSRDYDEDVVENPTLDIGVRGISRRSFGVELECDLIDYSTAQEIIGELDCRIGFSDDGSIDNAGFGKELQLPPLRGRAGFQFLESACQTLKSHGVRVNKSCGMHMHLQADDYLEDYEAMRNLFVFYSIVEPIIFSFLPKSRRNNHYCQTLEETYNIDDIRGAKTMQDFELLYYKTQSQEVVKRQKSDKYAGVRYMGVNIHALLSHKKCIEIRSHSATVDETKILNWYRLHSAILDQIKSGQIIAKKDLVHEMKEATTLRKKTSLFFKIVALPVEVRKYFRMRQRTFGSTAMADRKKRIRERGQRATERNIQEEILTESNLTI